MTPDKELSIDTQDLPADWLDQAREDRLAQRRKAILEKNRRKWLRRQRRRLEQQRRMSNG